MDIHHYTRASTLPLILQSGKIRFTRADQLDDESEMPFKTAHLDARNFFVSSWTSAVPEHSGQWFRYGDQHRGIRITLPSIPFEFHRVSFDLSRNCIAPHLQGRKVGIYLKDDVMPFTATEMLGKGYVIVPHAADMLKNFGGEVEYVTNPTKHATEFLSESYYETTFDDSGKLVRIKSETWTDQAEYRFVLMAMEGPNLDRSCFQDSYDEALCNLYESNIIEERIGFPSAKFIDLPLATDSLNKMIITLGTHISDNDREAVMDAINLYAPGIRAMESSMTVRRPN